MCHRLGGIFIDEAHGSFTDQMQEILNGLKISRTPIEEMMQDNDKIPIIGLTATPERSKESETPKLLKMYCGGKIFPRGEKFPSRTWSNLVNMRNHMIKEEYLSKPTFKKIEIEHVTHLNPKEDKEYKKASFSFDMLTSIHERNKKIKETLMDLVKTRKKVLYFGSTVSQAVGMSRILETIIYTPIIYKFYNI